MTAKEKATTIVKQFKGFEMPNEEIASVQCPSSMLKGLLRSLKDYNIDYQVTLETGVFIGKKSFKN